MEEADPSMKCIVFSQFTKYLDLVRAIIMAFLVCFDATPQSPLHFTAQPTNNCTCPNHSTTQIGEELRRANYTLQRLDGSMSLDVRKRNLQIFRTDSRCSVLLMSLRAGCHGLNLTVARWPIDSLKVMIVPRTDCERRSLTLPQRVRSNVILCDPWWNPMPEQQAMDRVHRTGQTKAVTVTKLIAESTIEQRYVSR
eukprot:SAG11_NODE_3443_length_2445_cov_1.454390_1_plen_196_part_00